MTEEEVIVVVVVRAAALCGSLYALVRRVLCAGCVFGEGRVAR